LKPYGYIYRIKNNENGKCYIGQTINGFDHRYASAGGCDIERVYNFWAGKRRHNQGYNKHLVSAIEKYGFSAFDIEKEFDVAYSKEELDKKEDEYIRKFDCIANGYNHKGGGAHGKYSESSKKKISEATKKWIKEKGHPSAGKKRTNVSIERMRNAQKKYFETHPGTLLGVPMSDSTKRKLSEAHKGKKLTQEHRRKIGLASSGKNNPAAKKVYVYDQKWNLIKSFDTVNDCGDWLIDNGYFKSEASSTKTRRATMRTLISRNIKRNRPFAGFNLSYKLIETVV